MAYMLTKAYVHQQCLSLFLVKIGGDEENRTPVRNPFNIDFYECSR